MYQLDYSSKNPIYMQIVEQTKHAIGKGMLLDGDQMPSVRELARTLTVNQSTITRAYKEMEMLGMIQTVPGKGAFVALNSKKRAWEIEKLEERFRELIAEGRYLGLSQDDIQGIVQRCVTEVEADDANR